MGSGTAGKIGRCGGPWPGADRDGTALERLRLRGVIPASPAELRDRSEGGTRVILGKVRKALRAERRRGQAGHWAYDLNRHLALVQALRLESRRLRAIERGGRASHPPAACAPPGA